MATKKKTGKKKTVKKKTVKKKTVKKKTVKKKALKKKAPAKKKIAKKKSPVKKKAGSKTSKQTKKSSKLKAKKKAEKKAKKTTKNLPSKTKTKKKTAPIKSQKVEKPKKSSKALPKLGPETLKIRERLLGKRNELLKLIQASKSLERDVGDLTFSNEIDLASSLEGREMVFQLTSRDRNELRLIEEAIFRINEGTYGACESCDKKINLKRLQIMPLTSLCIECQEAAENL